jgi:diguanylate cyclase (GGDEF)-like protein
MTESVEVLEGVIELLRKKVAAHPFEEVKQITCSFGVTVYQEDEDIHATIIRADKALYKAKVNGKNCFSSID